MADLAGLLEGLVKCALKKGADEVEAFGQRFESREVWLESNRIKNAKSNPGHGIGLKVIKKNSMGFASANSLDEKDFDELCDKAFALASANLKDKYQKIPEPQGLTEIKGLYDPKLAALELKEVIGMARRLLAAAHEYDKRVTVDSGGVFVGTAEKAIVNSKGLVASEKASDITALIMGMARDGDEVSAFDMEFDGSVNLAGLKLEPVARKLAENVIKSLGARPARSFTGTVLLAPNAVQETLLGPIISAVNSNSVQKGMSRLAGKQGTRIASKILTIEDDGLLKAGLATSAFDREGQPHHKLAIIQEGVLASYLYNSYTARKEARQTTGHASGGYRSIPGIGPTNLLIKPGKASKAELVRGIKEGILVTRFSGNANFVSGDLSGTVKGGFYIRNGKIVHPITNTMIAGNVFEAIANISGISKEIEKVYSFRLPYLAVEGLSITAG